jgi:hypothetical protein
MINFFRKIRKNLFMGGSTGTYFKYAIGEILLVVIGILIALQINNWNEQRKGKEFEKKILQDINKSLMGNLWQLNMAVDCNKGAIASVKLVLSNINEKKPYHDSLDIHFSSAISWCVPSLENTGYESLKSYGLNIITNNTIRDALSIYEIGWLKNLGQRQEDYFFNTASPVLTELFETVAMRTRMKPYDYKELRDSRKFLSILNTSMAYREDQIRWYKDFLGGYENLKRLIDDELGVD